EPGVPGHVLEAAAAEIPEQLARQTENLLPVRATENSPTRQEHIQEPVPVEVDQTNPSTNRLEDGKLVGLLPVSIDPAKPGAFCNISETRLRAVFRVSRGRPCTTPHRAKHQHQSQDPAAQKPSRHGHERTPHGKWSESNSLFWASSQGGASFARTASSANKRR